MPSPLSLPRLEASRLALFNRAISRDGMFSLSLEQTRWRLRFPIQADAGAWLGVTARIGAESLWLGFSPTWVHRLLGAWLDDSPEPSLAPEMRPLFLEMALADWLDARESTLGERIEITGTTPPPATPPAGVSLPLDWEPEAGGIPAPGLLVCSPALALRLADWLERLSPAPPLTWCGMIPFDLGLRLGDTRLTLAELRDIASGDLIRIEHAQDQRGESALLALHDWRWPVRLKPDSTVEILEFPMNPTPSPATSAPASLDDLPVTLVFEVGEKTLTLSELQRLRPGYCFALDRPLDQAVTLRANGKAVGQGELVELDGRLGVRVLAWVER
ncbi:type III secretion protein Q [Gammaproteobacteria bacterium]